MSVKGKAFFLSVIVLCGPGNYPIVSRKKKEYDPYDHK